MDITAKRKHARDERRKKGAELKTLRNSTPDSLGAVGGIETTDGPSSSKGIHFKDTPGNVSRLIDDYCNVSLERIYPGQGGRIKRKIHESELNTTLNNNPFNLRPVDLTAIVKQAIEEAQEPLTGKKRQTELKPRSSTPRYQWLSESEEQSDDSSKSTPRRGRTMTGSTRRGQTPRRDRDSDRSGSPPDRRHAGGNEPSFRELAKLMGDNLIALRKIQERPLRWGGSRMKT